MLIYKMWASDASFENCPIIFAQLLGIHCFIKTSYVPKCWILMPNLLDRTYDSVLLALKRC